MTTHTLEPYMVGRALQVALVGCGGNGSQMLTGLARMHVSLVALGGQGLRVHVFDPDVVTEANLGRQLFSPADLGQNKAAVLVNRINCFFGLDWHAYPTAYTGRRGEVLQNVDVLVGCVDTLAARRSLHRSSFTYWLDLGNKDRSGQVILGCKGGRPSGFTRARLKAGTASKHELALVAQLERRPKTFFEVFPQLKRKRKREEDNTPSCSLAGALEKQDLFINQAVSTFALQLLWQLLRHGSISSNGCFLNLETGRTQPIPLPEK